MSYSMVPIYTQAVGSSGATLVSFNNIPSSYTDLKLVVSARESAISDFRQPIFLTANNSSAGWSDTLILGNAGSASSTRNSYGASTSVMAGYTSGPTATSNTFALLETYIPNYTSSNFKQMLSESVVENNNSSSYIMNLSGLLWRNNSAITSLQISTYTTFGQHSTFSLYGIRNS